MKLTRRVLKNWAKPVNFEYPVRNLNLSQLMFTLMQESNGIGLAAPQCGISKRIFVIKIDNVAVAYFNPEIIQSSQNLIDLPERCLSFPEEECIIKRPETIDIKYQDYAGNWSEDQLTGLWSRCFQHELDHLNGVVMQQRYKEQYAE